MAKQENLSEQQDNDSLNAKENTQKQWHNPFLHLSPIKKYLKDKGFQCSQPYQVGLNNELLKIIDKSIQRVKDNGRSRVQLIDI